MTLVGLFCGLLYGSAVAMVGQLFSIMCFLQHLYLIFVFDTSRWGIGYIQVQVELLET